MREESRAGEGQLLALGDLAKVMVLSAFLFLSLSKQLQIFSSPLSLPTSHISTFLFP